MLSWTVSNFPWYQSKCLTVDHIIVCPCWLSHMVIFHSPGRWIQLNKWSRKVACGHHAFRDIGKTCPGYILPLIHQRNCQSICTGSLFRCHHKCNWLGCCTTCQLYWGLDRPTWCNHCKYMRSSISHLSRISSISSILVYSLSYMCLLVWTRVVSIICSTIITTMTHCSVVILCICNLQETLFHHDCLQN